MYKMSKIRWRKIELFTFINLVKTRIAGKYSTVHVDLSSDFKRTLCAYYSYIY